MKRLWTGLLLFALSGCMVESASAELSFEQEEPVVQVHEDPRLQAKIENLLASYQIDPNSIGIVVENYRTGQRYALNENLQFTAASLYKLPLAMLYYEAISQGLDSRTGYDFLPEYYEDAGNLSGDYALYETIALEELLFYSIVYSDNNAGHILFESMGGWQEYVLQRQKYYRQAPELYQILIENGGSAEMYEIALAPAQEEAGYEEVEIAGQESAEPSQDTVLVEAAPAGDLEEQEASEPSLEESVDLYTVIEERRSEMEYAAALANTMSPQFMSDCLNYIYEHQDIFEKLIADLMEAQPQAYLNATLNGFYAQKYGAYGGVLNIAGLRLGDEDYSIVVMSEGQGQSEEFMNALGVLVRNAFESSSSSTSKKTEPAGNSSGQDSSN